MRKLVAVLGLVGVVGCGSSTPPTHEPSSSSYDDRAENERIEVLSKLWSQECKTPEQKQCGYLTDRMTGEWMANFVRVACNEDPESTPSPACFDEMGQKVLEALRRRYTWAKEREVWAACAAATADCASIANFANIETLYILSHNKNVRAVAEQRVRFVREEQAKAEALAARRRAQEQAEEDERARRVMAAIGGALQGMGSAMAASSRRQADEPSYQTPGASSDPPRAARGTGSPSCSSDIQCGVGRICSKPAGSYSGVCAVVVDSFGTPNPMAPPRSDWGMGPGVQQCSFDLDCGIGFRCNQGRCLK